MGFVCARVCGHGGFDGVLVLAYVVVAAVVFCAASLICMLVLAIAISIIDGVSFCKLCFH